MPEDAGYSSEGLRAAKAVFEASEGASVLVIHNGRVLVSWGQTTRRFRCASIRKSYLSALYGIYVGKGKIDLNKTLADLNIDDIQGLTAEEKQAQVVHLLSARSGVYHPSAYSTRNMEKHLPGRGSHEPGTFWYYNNWDFNALATIFEQETGQGVFDAFKEHIAEPLQMEDFSLWKCWQQISDHGDRNWKIQTASR
ncbi:serine hydrolase [candidate division KSB1 bacterium]|nr:serine hydrolase [candidate division KSB1 bacterium]NIR72545.1 serine hydrolase [candidate division KSB1 bacterium]NIS23640.1 serine hydrolase [candidate division KSB1 bacterium]NIT70564.1 serine hydrolase [candidate division KSB1 bacterium]NIU24282.1 serine hydrolase [candidate division KSB1 bacterium]